jgi:hypothetical protein
MDDIHSNELLSVFCIFGIDFLPDPIRKSLTSKFNEIIQGTKRHTVELSQENEEISIVAEG